MQFISTRGEATPIDFHKLILSGTASDRGLFVPEGSVMVSETMLTSLQQLPYAEVAARLIGPHIGEFPVSKLRAASQQAYTAEKFRYARDGDDPAKIVPTCHLWGNLYLAGLSNGPTLAFKDIAMQLLAPLVIEAMDHFGLDFYTILLGTSGDTGSAAIHAFMQYPQVRMYVMAGGVGMTDFQRRQMFGVQAEQLHCMLFNDFDQTQGLLKAVFEDQDFVQEVNLGAVNSVNLVRLLAQMVYAFTTYLDVVDEIGETVDYVVPSGNFGDAHSVYMAKLMGLPVGRIIVATNQNDVLRRVINTGVYERATVNPSMSPSMDIQAASNFERTLYYAQNQNAARINSLYSEFAATGSFRLSEDELDLLHGAGFEAVTCSEDDCRITMGQVYIKTDLLVDPHTAVGIHAAAHAARHGVKTVVYETAREIKFAQAVANATGATPEIPATFAGMMCTPLRFDSVDTMSAEELKARIRG